MRYAIAFVTTMLVRLGRFLPNNDPIMAGALPLARTGRWWMAPLYAGASMALFDLLTGRLGMWTIGTTLTYALLMLIAQKTIRASYASYLGHSIIGILLFDLITGPILTSAYFPSTFAQAFVGQVPFTLMHLATGVTYTALVVPLLDPDISVLPDVAWMHAVRRWAHAQ